VSPIFAANLALALFALSEVVLRRGRPAKSVAPGKDDRGTSLQILVSYVVAALLLVAAGRFGGEPSGLTWRWTGVAAAFVGLALRWWGMITLGGFYTRTLTTVGAIAPPAAQRFSVAPRGNRANYPLDPEPLSAFAWRAPRRPG